MPDIPQSKNGVSSPLYSSGTTEMDSKNNQGKVDGPKGSKPTPDPLGYKKGEDQ